MNKYKLIYREVREKEIVIEAKNAKDAKALVMLQTQMKKGLKPQDIKEISIPSIEEISVDEPKVIYDDNGVKRILIDDEILYDRDDPCYMGTKPEERKSILKKGGLYIKDDNGNTVEL